MTTAREPLTAAGVRPACAATSPTSAKALLQKSPPRSGVLLAPTITLPNTNPTREPRRRLHFREVSHV